MTQEHINTLLTLLQLRAGLLERSAAEMVEARLGSDSTLQQHWNQLCQALEQSPSAVEANTANAGETAWDSETVAAFVENRLPGDEARRLEDACWKSPPLLAEVISTFQFLQASEVEPATRLLTERLSQLYANTEPVAPPPVNGRKMNAATPALTAATRASSASIADATRRARKQQERWNLVVGLAVVLIAATGLIAFQLLRPRPDDVAQPPDAAPPASPEQESFTPDRIDPQLVTPKPELPEPSAPLLEQPLVDDSRPDRPRPIIPDPLVPDPRSERPAVPRPSRTAYVAIAWDRIEGLLARQDSRTGRWVGALSSIEQQATASYATLVDSWAESQPTDFGRLVLDAETSLNVAREPDTTDHFVLDLYHGRVALQGVPDSIEMTLQASATRCRVKATQPDSAIAWERQDQTARLIVRSGSVLFNDEPLEAGNQVTWQDEEWTTVAARATGKWWDRPTRRVRLADTVRQELLTSNNLSVDLRNLASDDLPALRQWGHLWSVALFPDDSTYAAMTSSDPLVRYRACEWLAAADLVDPQRRRAWRSLATATQDATMVRALSRGAALARRRLPLERNDARQMVRGLNHQDLAIRQGCIYFLELYFGRRVRYDANSPRNERQTAAQQWNQVLR